MAHKKGWHRCIDNNACIPVHAWWKMPTTQTSICCAGYTSARRWCRRHTTSTSACCCDQGGIAWVAVSDLHPEIPPELPLVPRQHESERIKSDVIRTSLRTVAVLALLFDDSVEKQGC